MNKSASVDNTVSTAKLIADYAIYVQDQWKTGNFTVSLAARFEGLVTHASPGFAGPSLYAPTRNITFDEKPWGNQKDITPRLGVAWDVFGDGKTALRASLNKYIAAAGYSGFNQAGALSTSVTRNWTDANNNRVPDCNLANVNQQDLRSAGGDLCGQVSNLAFGSVTPTAAIDPATYTGWGTRSYNWELSVSGQRQLRQGLSVNAGYFRRWFGNFTVAENTSVSAADYTSYTFTAPLDSRLPGGGGFTVTSLDLNPTKVGQVSNYTTFASNFGNQYQHWNGIDLGIDYRVKGILFQGGSSTGRTSTDNCDIVAQRPELLVGGTVSPAQFCHQDTNFLTQLKFLGAYTIPKIGLQTSATFQSLPGPNILANYIVTTAVAKQSLGRDLSANAANQTVSIVAPGTMYGERLNQLDLRFSKLLKFSSTRTMLSLDLYNAFNANPVTLLNNNYASWQVPQGILDARIVKGTVQFDF